MSEDCRHRICIFLTSGTAATGVDGREALQLPSGESTVSEANFLQAVVEHNAEPEVRLLARTVKDVHIVTRYRTGLLLVASPLISDCAVVRSLSRENWLSLIKATFCL